MTYPEEGTLLALLGHALGDTFAVDAGGELVLSFTATSGKSVPAPVGALDDLEGRGWIRVRPDGTTAETRHGRYWLCRWLRSIKREDVIRKLKPMAD